MSRSALRRKRIAADAPARATRTRGELTRQEIIAATQRVIARDGVRAVTHRSVAQEAEVNLSLTTYYFTDLYALTAAAFQAFTDADHTALRESWERGFRYLSGVGDIASASEATRLRVRDYVLNRVCEYVEHKLSEQAVGLALEHQFFFAALNDPRLVEMANIHRSRLVQPMIELCRLFGSLQPEVDADLLFGTIIRHEYEALLHASPEADIRRMRRELKRLLDFFLGLNA